MSNTTTETAVATVLAAPATQRPVQPLSSKAVFDGKTVRLTAYQLRKVGEIKTNPKNKEQCSIFVSSLDNEHAFSVVVENPGFVQRLAQIKQQIEQDKRTRPLLDIQGKHWRPQNGTKTAYPVIIAESITRATL